MLAPRTAPRLRCKQMRQTYFAKKRFRSFSTTEKRNEEARQTQEHARENIGKCPKTQKNVREKRFAPFSGSCSCGFRDVLSVFRRVFPSRKAAENVFGEISTRTLRKLTKTSRNSRKIRAFFFGKVSALYISYNRC